MTDLSKFQEVQGDLDVVEHVEPHVTLVPGQMLSAEHLE